MALLKLIEEKYLSTLISTHCKHNFCNLTVTTVKFFVFSERKKTVTRSLFFYKAFVCFYSYNCKITEITNLKQRRIG